MNIHREGRVFLVLLTIALVIFNWLVYLYLPGWLFILLLSSALLLGFFTQFFRNPNRQIPLQDNAVLSPADGTVVVIEKVFEDEYFKDERIQVSVFMSPLNVHLNRVPIDGTVVHYKYHPGKYLVAFHPKSSKLNERNTAVIKTSTGKEILLRQIAGAVARRIRFYLKPGQQVKQGEELGFIKFGSRMDIFLPLDSIIRVQLKEKVIGGQSILAELPENR